MLTTHTKWLLPLTVVLLSGGFSSYAQTQTGSAKTDAYVVKLLQENQRDADVMTKLKNDRLDAIDKRVAAETDCMATTSPTSRKTCMDTAVSNYNQTIRTIEKEEHAEQTLHAKNINLLEHTADEGCTRLDCVNSTPKQKANCPDGNCKKIVD